MKPLPDKKAFKDFQKKHLNRSREQWLRKVQAKAKRLKQPDLESLFLVVKGKKKAKTEEEEFAEGIDYIHETAEGLNELGHLVTEVHQPTYSYIAKIDRPLTGPSAIINLIAAGLALIYTANKAINKFQKKKDKPDEES